MILTKRILILILLAMLLGLQYALWLGDKNIRDLRSLQAASAETKEQNRKQEQINQRRLVEVLDLKQGGKTVETLARYNLGLIKENETFYQIIE